MKKLFITIICFVVLLLFCNCSSGKYIVSANGDIGDVKLKSGKEYTGEIVFISDTAIFFATTPANQREVPTLYYSLNEEIKSVTVQGYDGSGWVSPVLLFQVLPAGLMAGAAASAETDNPVLIGLIFTIPAIITSILFASTEGEAPQWNDELPIQEIETLKLYSRYPEEPNQMEIIKLLKRYNQKAIKKLF